MDTMSPYKRRHADRGYFFWTANIATWSLLFLIKDDRYPYSTRACGGSPRMSC